MKTEVFTFNPFAENTYLVYDKEGGTGIIIDPGCMDSFEHKELETAISDRKLQIQEILLTHAHIDHILGCARLCELYKTGMVMHADDKFLFARSREMAQMFGIPYAEPPEPSRYFQVGETYHAGNVSLLVRHTPGHSPGSVSFVNEEAGIIIGGDVLFKNSIGRTDLPGGDINILLNSIREEFFIYPDHFRILSGHDEETTIGSEKRYNPFLK